MKIVFHPEAYEEMLESARFYDERDEGLGLQFLEAVEETTRHIRQFPLAGPIEQDDIRKRLVSGFPFTVLYQLQENRILIAAVMHQHRRPGYWRKRIGRVSRKSPR
ncbi:MAG TPA: type II toxin-antitoxin system RelE/ParE family toxin [Blastocatellia bacterium]|nr:type II toxin-antitoxin system RelE/ParE family toxin [Blastocatellia bacterium]